MRQIFLLISLAAALALACAPQIQAFRVKPIPSPCTARPDLPLSIGVDYAMFELEPEVFRAAAQWAAVMDRPTFYAAQDGEEPQVYVTSGPVPPEGKGKDWVASASTQCHADGRLSWVITFHRPEFGYSAQCFMVHELGHVLGLDHTTRQTSIMRARPCPDLLSEDGEDTTSEFDSIPRITPEDATTARWIWR
jgi:hypothetical protein